MSRTDADVAGLLIDETTPEGYVKRGSFSGATLPTTASKFAVGCELICSDGRTYRNAGTVAVPSWNDQDKSDANSEIGTLYQQVSQVALTAAQINGMYAAPVVVVAGVTGKSIIVDSVEFDITRTSTQFANGGNVAVQYDSTANGAGTATHAVIASTVVTGTAGRTVTARIPVVLSDVASTSIVGKGLYISNASGAFDTGTGTAVVTVRYHLV